VASIKQLAHDNPLPPLGLLLAVLLAAVMAKLDHSGWAATAMLAFYPAYLGTVAVARIAVCLLARVPFQSAAERSALARLLLPRQAGL
jgi:hypothetical protein